MEIGSISGMQQSMAMGQMRPPPPGDSTEESGKMSSLIMEQQDADSDGLLSADELGSSIDSEVIDELDTNGDGFVSQEELQAGLKSNMDTMKASFESGSMPTEEAHAFMEQMHSLAGDNPGTRNKATEAYGLMQNALFGGSQEASSYNTDQLLLENLSMTV